MGETQSCPLRTIAACISKQPVRTLLPNCVTLTSAEVGWAACADLAADARGSCVVVVVTGGVRECGPRVPSPTPEAGPDPNPAPTATAVGAGVALGVKMSVGGAGVFRWTMRCHHRMPSSC